MKYTKYLTDKQKKQLEYEVVSRDLRVYLTRLLDDQIENGGRIYRLNSLINNARNLLGLPIYVLEADGYGEYESGEYAWHEGEFQLLMRRFDTISFIEYICELVIHDWFDGNTLNDLFEKDGLSFRIDNDMSSISVDVMDLKDIKVEDSESAHPNIRVLVNRMERSLENNDLSSVLHSSASIFETLAKDIVPLPTVQDKTLGSFFDRYRQDSRLPEELLDMILNTYKLRGSEPLAGHGSTSMPTITKEQAVVLCEMTKAFVKIEYTLQNEAAE